MKINYNAVLFDYNKMLTSAGGVAASKSAEGHLIIGIIKMSCEV